MEGKRTRRDRIAPGPGQESVWDYPRPPAVEHVDTRVEVVFAGQTIADTHRAVRVLETSHPPVYYIPLEDIRTGVLEREPRTSLCEFKGLAYYVGLKVGDRHARSAGWTYPDPAPGYEALRDHVAFYPSRVDAARVDGVEVTAQPGDFYGGWITPDVVGPFKGGPGTMGW